MTTEQASPLFALDIGTRSVVGLILCPHDNQYVLVDSIIKEHDDRAMLDGQIHDVQSVAATIRDVKERLELKHGPLNTVCVAAAGRSLKTRRAKIDLEISTKPIFNHDDVIHLELSAVQQAQFQLANELTKETQVDYYCVGYSVLAYTLDKEPIGSLIDQTGKVASVEVIATFLPNVVIESLLSSLTRADLELEALTLEPIAAINVLIPRSMRRLNVALVDIGAGTSDIALTDENTVIAYGMVPIAGDEVTEALSDHFLLDFPDAERVKKELTSSDSVTMTDILGMEMTYNKDEVIAPLEATIHKLARTISDEILTLNGRAPKAVMLVGGGSMTPMLPALIASYLKLPENRVAIRDASAIQQLITSDDKKYGPELVTPIGIALAAKENPIKSVSITVNGRKLRLFDIKKLTVGDGLLAAGINIAKLYGKPGLAIMVTVQDRLISIPGEYGQPPILLNNGQLTSLDELLEPKDELIVERGQHGNQATITIGELLGDIPSQKYTLNGEIVHLKADILQNGKNVGPDAHVQDRDHISTNETKTVRDLLSSKNVPSSLFEPYHFYVDDERWDYKHAQSTIHVNGNEVGLDHPIVENDTIEWKTTMDPKGPTIEEVFRLNKIHTNHSISVFYNEKPVTLNKQMVEMKRNEEVLHMDSFINHNDRLTLKTKTIEPFILQDVFSAIDINLSEFKGKKITLLQNGKKTVFNQPLKNGDKVELYAE